MELYRKYRPQDFNEISGQESAVRMLEGFLQNSSVPHSLLFVGPSGVGKTTLARIVARKLEAEVHEYNVADFRGIDTIREIRDRVQMPPLLKRCRCIILDEAHKLTSDSQNALLKLLEDCPEHSYFILCSTQPDRLITTVLNRCVVVRLSELADESLAALLRRVARREGKALDPETEKAIISNSRGSGRKALVLLEQYFAGGELRDIETTETTVADLCRALIKRATWPEVVELVQNLEDEDPETVRRVVLAYAAKAIQSRHMPTAARAYLIIAAFSRWFSFTKPHLYAACFEVLCEE